MFKHSAPGLRKVVDAYLCPSQLEKIISNRAVLQVTNDSVLEVLYKMVSQPSPAPGSMWLSPSNLVITSIVQNDVAALGTGPGPTGR